MLTPRGRYQTLDVWRGLAALAVVIFHCTNTFVTHDTWFGSVLLAGWMGVFVFFPISGYCVFAAVSRQENATVRHFLHRRWRRILPPYWGSVVVALGLALAALPFNAATIGSLRFSGGTWLSVLTLTQVFIGKPDVINPVYWSLCYEEQFYIIVATLLFFPMRRRCWAVLVITAIATLYGLPSLPDRLRVTGLFLAFWLPFSGGIAAYLWLERPEERPFAIALLMMLVASAVLLWSPALLVSAAASLVFILLAPLDATIVASPSARPLVGLGVISYSLYLVHVPVGGRLVNLLNRQPVSPLLASIAGIAASVVAGWLFHRIVERRFVNTKTLPARGEARVAAAVA